MDNVFNRFCVLVMVTTFTVSNFQQLKQTSGRKTAPGPSKIPPAGKNQVFQDQRNISSILFFAKNK